MVSTETTLGELVTAHPEAARVLYDFGMDYCCGGNQTIRKACEDKGIDAQVLLRKVEEEQALPEDSRNWEEAPLAELISHILTRYHQPLRKELPRLVVLAEKVEGAHGGEDDCPEGLADLLRDVMASVESHLMKEEKILFPAIEAGQGPLAGGPIRSMVLEHEDHGRNLARIRRLTNNLEPSPTACRSWNELYRYLAALEVDLMDHIHLENNILFPRALNG